MRVDRSRLPDVGPDPAFRFPGIVRHTLHNGLQVRTVQHRTMPVISMVVQVDGGSAADPRGREGLTAMTADMLDEGTGSLTAIEVSDGLARIGAQYDADVGADVTSLSLTTLRRFAERGATWLADLLARPSLRANDFDRVRQMRLDRLRQLNDVPPAVAERAFLRLMYGEHPYGHLAIGNALSLGAMTLEDVTVFHAARFGPSRTTVTVVGPDTHDALVRLVGGAFADWSDAANIAEPAAPVGATQPEAPSRLTIVPREGAPQSELRIGHLSARRDSPDYPALLVMNAIVGGAFASRVNLKLREEKGFTYGARSAFDWRRGLAPFVVRASVHTEATAEAISDCLAEFDGIRGVRPPSQREMVLAKASLTRGYPRGFETAQQVAGAVARLALHGLPDTYFEEFVPRVRAVGAGEVVRVAQRYIDPARAVALVVGDYDAIVDSLLPLGLGEAQSLVADA